MRRQMGADLSQQYRTLPIKLTESVEMAIDPPAINVQPIQLKELLAERSDLKAWKQAVLGDDFSIRGAANELRPDLSFVGSSSSYGRGGNFLANRAGFGESLSELFSFGYPTYTFGLQITLPDSLTTPQSLTLRMPSHRRRLIR
jgi:outer membrane protein TolC